MGGRGEMGAPGELPEGATEGEMPGGMAGGGAGGGMGGGGMGGDNELTTRFLENEEFTALYEGALADLQADLVESGTLAELVNTWVEVVSEGASELIDADALQGEADDILAYVSTEVEARSGSREETDGVDEPGTSA